MLRFSNLNSPSIVALLATMLISFTPGALALGVTEHYRDYSNAVYDAQGMVVYRIYAREFHRELLPQKLSLLSLFSMRAVNNQRSHYEQGVLLLGDCPLYFEKAYLSEMKLRLYRVHGTLPEGNVVAAEMSYQIATHELAGEDLTLTPTGEQRLLRKRHYQKQQPVPPRESCISGSTELPYNPRLYK